MCLSFHVTCAVDLTYLIKRLLDLIDLLGRITLPRRIGRLKRDLAAMAIGYTLHNTALDDGSTCS